MTYNDTIMRALAFIPAAASLALGGCAASRLETDYAHSVRQMTENQVYDRATLTRPRAAPVEGADPDMLNLAVQTLRMEKVDRTQVSQPMTINIGSQGQQP